MAVNDNNVKFYEPDYSLQSKLGVSNIDELIGRETISRAQDAIEMASDKIVDDCFRTLSRLSIAYEDLKHAHLQPHSILKNMIDAAFKIKVKAGQGGNIIAATIAQSLQRHAEAALNAPLSAQNLLLIEWHVNNLCYFMRKRLKGYGGPAGEALLREISQLAVNKAN